MDETSTLHEPTGSIELSGEPEREGSEAKVPARAESRPPQPGAAGLWRLKSVACDPRGPGARLTLVFLEGDALGIPLEFVPELSSATAQDLRRLSLAAEGEAIVVKRTRERIDVESLVLSYARSRSDFARRFAAAAAAIAAA